MLAGLQGTHWFPTEYTEGPVPLVHFPHSGSSTFRLRLRQMKLFNILTFTGSRMTPFFTTRLGNINGH